jgi:hypothetical protein
VRQLGLELSNKRWVMLVLGVRVFQLIDGVGERLGDKAAAVFAEVAACVGLLVCVHGVDLFLKHRSG